METKNREEQDILLASNQLASEKVEKVAQALALLCEACWQEARSNGHEPTKERLLRLSHKLERWGQLLEQEAAGRVAR